MRRIVVGFTLTLSVVLAATASAGEPVHREIPYKKTVSLYTPKTYTFHFSIYDAEGIDGTELWFEDRSVRLTRKILSYTLGSSKTFEAGVFGPLDFSEQYWVQVSYWTGKVWKVIGVRDKLTAAPYALWSVNPGPVGEQGPAGPQGEQGPTGECILAGFECPDNQYLIGFNPDGSPKCRRLPKMISHRFEVIVNNTANWSDAETICSSLGGYLATITGKAESDELRTLIQVNPEGEYWLGGTDQGTELSWVWSTGETWDYTLWIPSYPREATNLNCLVYRRVSTLDGWSDWDCSQAAKGFVCEYEF